MTKKLNQYFILHFQHFGAEMVDINDVREYFAKYCLLNNMPEEIQSFDLLLHYYMLLGYIDYDGMVLRLTKEFVEAYTNTSIIEVGK